MVIDSVWIVGQTRSGKTARLIEQFRLWSEDWNGRSPRQPGPRFLVFAANGDNRIVLADRLLTVPGADALVDTTTPLGFFQDEVRLFWPLLTEQLGLTAQFPLRLRPETEQELATALWQPELESKELHLEGVTDYFMVRRSLDLLQLAAVAGVPPEDLTTILQEGLMEGTPELWECVGRVLLRWRQWCLDRGLLTYGITTELYWRYLLPHPTYQNQLHSRYQAVLADDVDEYPAIAYTLFSNFLDRGKPGVFTYNPNGAIRLGLGADPGVMVPLSDRCRVEHLQPHPDRSLAVPLGDAVVQWVTEPSFLPTLPDSFQVIQTVSRAQLLRQTAEIIATGIHTQQVQPQEVAVIGPGLDAIARYTLRTLLLAQGIAVEALNDQQPLASSPMIRALLTLMTLIYPGLGHLVNRESVAEMLVMLSLPIQISQEPATPDQSKIDPVRAGLITDYCFVPDPDHPHLLAATQFPRWDRLGYQATAFYGEMVQWIEAQRLQQQQRLIPSPVTLLDRAIQRFLYGGSHLPYDQLAALRELVETAHHYWEVDARLRQSDRTQPLPNPIRRADQPASATVEQFIQLLRSGTITADPYPAQPLDLKRQAVTLATIFQYRSYRLAHRWHFWLDAGSPLWLTGGGPLFGAPLLLQEWSGRPWSPADAIAADQRRLQRQLLDLMGRVEERVYLCHSDLSTNGQEQTGSLITLVNAGVPIEFHAIATAEQFQ